MRCFDQNAKPSQLRAAPVPCSCQQTLTVRARAVFFCWFCDEVITRSPSFVRSLACKQRKGFCFCSVVHSIHHDIALCIRRRRSRRRRSFDNRRENFTIVRVLVFTLLERRLLFYGVQESLRSFVRCIVVLVAGSGWKRGFPRVIVSALKVCEVLCKLAQWPVCNCSAWRQWWKGRLGKNSGVKSIS